MRANDSCFRRACRYVLLLSVLILVSAARGEDLIDYDTGIEKVAAYIRQGDLHRAELTVTV